MGDKKKKEMDTDFRGIIKTTKRGRQMHKDRSEMDDEDPNSSTVGAGKKTSKSQIYEVTINKKFPIKKHQKIILNIFGEKNIKGIYLHKKDKYKYQVHLKKGGLFQQTVDGSGFTDNIKQIFSIKQDYNNASKKVLAKYGDIAISSLEVIRMPIPGVFSSVANKLSMGQVNKEFEHLYHVALVATVKNKQIFMEKLATVNITDKYPISEQTEIINVPMNGQTFTINNLLQKALDSVGPEKFWSYDGLNNNCQFFVSYLLGSVGLFSPNVKKFTFQDLTNVRANIPGWAGNVANVATTTAALLNKWSGGANKDLSMSDYARMGKIGKFGEFKADKKLIAISNKNKLLKKDLLENIKNLIDEHYKQPTIKKQTPTEIIIEQRKIIEKQEPVIEELKEIIEEQKEIISEKPKTKQKTNTSIIDNIRNLIKNKNNIILNDIYKIIGEYLSSRTPNILKDTMTNKKGLLWKETKSKKEKKPGNLKITPDEYKLSKKKTLDETFPELKDLFKKKEKEAKAKKEDKETKSKKEKKPGNLKITPDEYKLSKKKTLDETFPELKDLFKKKEKEAKAKKEDKEIDDDNFVTPVAIKKVIKIKSEINKLNKAIFELDQKRLNENYSDYPDSKKIKLIDEQLKSYDKQIQDFKKDLEKAKKLLKK